MESAKAAAQRASCGASLSVDLVTAPATVRLAAWDKLVASTPGTDVTQLSAWARVRRFDGFFPAYLFASRDGSLVGGVQILFRRVPGFGLLGYSSYGPVIPGPVEETTEVAGLLARRLTGLPGTRMLFVQPPEGGSTVRQQLLSQGFRSSSAGIASTGSVRLDVARSDDDILRGFPPRLRSWARRWADEGVRVRRGGADDIPLLADLMRATADAHGLRLPPRVTYLRHMYAELVRSGNLALFIGEVHGRPVTADVVTICGGMVRGRLSGFDRSGKERRLCVPGAARWEIIRWARRSGYRWLDFGGLSEQTLQDAVEDGIRSSNSWPGPDSAKMQFGGTPYRYPGPVELIRPTVVRWSYDTVSNTVLGRTVTHSARLWLRRGAGRPFAGRRLAEPEGGPAA